MTKACSNVSHVSYHLEVHQKLVIQAGLLGLASGQLDARGDQLLLCSLRPQCLHKRPPLVADVFYAGHLCTMRFEIPTKLLAMRMLEYHRIS